MVYIHTYVDTNKIIPRFGNNQIHVLLVLALPHFTRVPSDQTAWEGEEVSFPCEADGTPKPVIFWTMEGSQVCI